MAKNRLYDFEANGRIYTFEGPEGANPESFHSALMQQVAADEAKQKAHLEKTGFMPALKAAGRGALGATEEYLGEKFNAPSLIAAGQEQKQKAATTFEPTTSEDISAAQGVLPTASRAISKYVTEPVGGIAGRFGVPVAAGIGAVALAPEELALSPFLVSGAATSLANLPIAAGENIERQKEVGAPVDVAKAELYGIAQSILAGFVPFGGKVNKVIGPQLMAEAERLAPAIVEGSLTREAAAKALSSKAETFLRATGANAVTGTGLMVGTEALTRGAAGQNLADEEALNAYKEQTQAALAMSPIFGALHPKGRAGALSKLEEAEGRYQDVGRINTERAQRDMDIINQNMANRAEAEAALARASEAQKEQIRAQINAAPDRPIMDIINEVTGVSQEPVGISRQAVKSALDEPSGIRVNDVNGVERELTMGELHELRNPDLYAPIPEPFEARPVKEQIESVTGIKRDEPATTKKNVEAALNEPSGVRVVDPVTQVERELTNGELLRHRNPDLFAEKVKAAELTKQDKLPFETPVEKIAEERVATSLQRDLFNDTPLTSLPKLDKSIIKSFGFNEKSPGARALEGKDPIADAAHIEKVLAANERITNNKRFPERAAAVDEYRSLVDAYNKESAQRKVAESAATESGRETIGDRLQDTGGSGRRVADTSRAAGSDVRGMDATRSLVPESTGGTGGKPATLREQQFAERARQAEAERQQAKAEALAQARQEQEAIRLQQEAATTRAEQDRLAEEAQAKADEIAAKSDEELPVVDERAKEPDVDIEQFEANKSLLNTYIRQTVGGVKNIVPEERISHAQAMIALADIMTHIVRQGVRNVGHAMREARKALGGQSKLITDDQLKAAYDTATARVKEEPAKTEGKAGAKAADPELEQLHREAGGRAADTEKPSSAFQSMRDNPEKFVEEKKKGLQHFLDNLETQYFSSDAGLSKAIRRGVQSTGATWETIKKLMHEVSTSQALHAEGVAHRFLEMGGIKYNPELMKFEAFENKEGSWKGTIDAIKAAADAKGVSYGEMEQYAHKALEARRLKLDVIPYNERLRAKEDALVAKGEKTQAAADRDYEENAKAVHMTDAQIAAGMKFFDKIPQLNEVVKQWDTTRKNVIDFAVETGLYTKDKADALYDTLAYVPFFRVEQLENRAGPKEFSRGLLDAATDKKFKGSYQDVNNIFDNMERWTSYMIRKGVNNKSAQNLTKAAKKYLPDEVRTVDRVAHGMRENTFSIWENGEKTMYEFKDPMFVHAFTGMESVAIPALEGFAWFTNVLRQNIVLNPLFSVGQLSQDAFGAMLSSGLKHPFAIPLEVMKEFGKTLRGGSIAHEELKNLGAVGLRDYSATASRVDAEIAAGLKAPTKFQRFKAPFEKLSMASDNAVRQAIYNRTLLETGGKKMPDGRIVGGDKATATERAFEIINFRRSGASKNVAVLRRTVPFFGAYLQSMNVAMKVLSGRGISPAEKTEAYRVLASNLAKVMALGFIYNTVISEDEGYKKLDPTVRDRHLIIPGTDGVMIPLRSDVFTLLAKIIPEHMYQMTMAEETEDATKAKKAIGAAVSNALLSPNVMPQAIKPLVEVGLNKNLWTGQPIVGQGQEMLEKELQFGPSTSQLAKAIGSTGLFSPLSVDYLLKSYFGYTGGMLLQGTDAAIAQVTGEVIPDKSGRDMLASIPGMSTFVSKEFGTRDMNDFYELKAETNRAVATMNKLKEIGSPEEVQAYREENQDLILANKRVERIANNLSKLKKQERRIQAADYLTAEEKQEMLYGLKVREHQMLGAINDLRKTAGL